MYSGIAVGANRDGCSFLPVDPSAEGTYGETKPKGLAIDGGIEGQYLDSDDTSDFKNDHYRGWVPWK